MYLLVSNPSNIFYLTGFQAGSLTERESYAIAELSGEPSKVRRVWHLVPEMFAASAKQSPKVSLEIIKPGEKLLDKLLKLLPKNSELYFEAADLKFGEFQRLNEHWDELLPSTNVLESLRRIKSPAQVKAIKQAVRQSEKAFERWVQELAIGQTELAATARLLELLGVEERDLAFPPIVAFAQNSAIPHHVPGSRKLQKNDIVLVDWGVKVNNYVADLTRTFVFGEPDKRFRERFALVNSAFEASCASLAAGRPLAKIWEVAAAALGAELKHMPHSLGHGIGLDVHESPSIGPKSEEIALKNEILTIEPGVYYKGWGGIRLEGDFLITANGCERLDSLPFFAAHKEYLD
jgi:Xaa-Pro aminopeptidase